MPLQLLIPNDPLPARPRRAFTLIELLVVMTIIVIMATISIPAIKTLTKGNKLAQSVNLVRSYLANARSIAISEHRMCGIIFFEETSTNVLSPLSLHSGQTAMQLIAEDRDQTPYKSPNTGFVYYTRNRQYMPTDIQVATLNDDPTKTVNTGAETTNIARVILFDATGQLVVRKNLARPLLTGPNVGGYPKAYGDWNLSPAGTINSVGVSSPGLLIFNYLDFQQQNFAPNAAGQQSAAAWIQSQGDVILINPYTGGIIR